MTLVFIAISCTDTTPAPSIVGKWAEQNGTPWEFTADGKVAIKGTAGPTYFVDGKQLTIDYHDTQSLSITFSFEITEGKLTLQPLSAKGDGPLPMDWEQPTVLVRAG